MKPAILIIHGAWHIPQHYETFTDRLAAAGYEVHIPHLPSSGQLAAQSTLEDDAKIVHQQLEDLVTKNSRQVIVIAHSYGGAVANQALADELLHYDKRRTKDLAGGVLHIIYVCAFMLQPGESCISAGQPRPVPEPIAPADDGTCFLALPGRELFYNDVQDEELVARCEKELVRHSFTALGSPISYPAWKHLPTTFLRCSEDKVLFLEWQDNFIKAVKESGSCIEVETYRSGHSPFLSMPEKTMELVERVVSKYIKQ